MEGFYGPHSFFEPAPWIVAMEMLGPGRARNSILASQSLSDSPSVVPIHVADDEFVLFGAATASSNHPIPQLEATHVVLASPREAFLPAFGAPAVGIVLLAVDQRSSSSNLFTNWRIFEVAI